MRLRHYLVLNDDLRRLSMAVMSGKGALPALANSRQRVIQAVSQPVGSSDHIRCTGSYYSFDERGFLNVAFEDLQPSIQLVESGAAIDEERRRKPDAVNLALRREQRDARNSVEWRLTDRHQQMVSDDFNTSTRRIRFLQGKRAAVIK